MSKTPKKSIDDIVLPEGNGNNDGVGGVLKEILRERIQELCLHVSFDS